ncbi:MAG: DUF86 domain-containing protein [Methylococcales bacterium]
MRDIAYEQALLKHQRDMLEMLNQYSQQDPNQWTRHDLFAIQRVLQIFIESFISIARYLVQQKYKLSVSQSREALDELKNRNDLTVQQHKQLLKIVGFRNVLVHDYLEINDDIVAAIIVKKNYLFMEDILTAWQTQLSLLE